MDCGATKTYKIFEKESSANHATGRLASQKPDRHDRSRNPSPKALDNVQIQYELPR
jgi:hypothetical protein